MMDTEWKNLTSQPESVPSSESESEQDTEQSYGIGEKRKRETSRQNYFKGEARDAYRLCKSLDDSFKDRTSSHP